MPNAPKTFRWVQPQSRQQADRQYDRKRNADPALSAAAKFRSSVVWQRFRDWYKREHPLCVDPFRDHPHEVRPVEDVHHVLGLAERLDLGLDADNCRSLCRACHAKVEGMARAGRPTAQLFGAPRGGSASPGA